MQGEVAGRVVEDQELPEVAGEVLAIAVLRCRRPVLLLLHHLQVFCADAGHLLTALAAVPAGAGAVPGHLGLAEG